jgi:hypothetical protein
VRSAPKSSRATLTSDRPQPPSDDSPADLDRLVANRALARMIARMLWDCEHRRLSSVGAPRGAVTGQRKSSHGRSR